MADLLILGAGPAGLGAAYRAATAGHTVTVVEREDHVGGLASSFEVDGVRVDHGSHRLHPSTAPEILAELRRLLGDDLQVRPRNGRIRLADRWIAFPLRTGDLLRHLPPGFAARAALDAATGWTRSPRTDTFDEVLRAGIGPTMTERFYAPYARKLWGLEPHELSGEQARRRVGASSGGALLRRVLGPGPGRGRRSPQARAFLYPRRGFGQLWERLADAAVDAGATVRLASTATAVDTDADSGRVTLADGRTLTGDAVWSTVPLPVLARLADAPPDVRDAASRLRSRAMALVYLSLDTRRSRYAPRYTPYDAHYLPAGDTPVTRFSEPANYRDGRGTDPADRTVLCAEIPCSRGDDVWEAPREVLADRFLGTLASLGLPRPPVRGVTVRRLPSVYPIYDLGYDEAFARVDRWAAAQPRLLTFGRQGLFAHDNSHHALAMAWAAADALGSDGRLDHAAWVRARERFAQHVVED